MSRITRPERTQIEALIEAYQHYRPHISLFQDQLLMALSSAEDLKRHVHSIRARLKEPDHLRGKLVRKLLSCKSDHSPFDITPDNLLMKINDLAGVRILHLYTRQVREIDTTLREIFHESQYELVEGPFARTWDDESREFFRQCGIETQDSPSLYTSVHYVIGSASRTRATAEIQVRTLMEEVWGEVDHSLNYPQKTSSVACAEQLKVLARVTSSATRLVDSIFITIEDHIRGHSGAPIPPSPSATAAGARESVQRLATQSRKKGTMSRRYKRR